MKKKLFTLLALAAMAVGSASADDITVTWLPNNMTAATTAGTASVENILTVSDLTISSTLTGPTLKTANSTKWGGFATMTTDAGKNNASPKDCITFSVKVQPGYTFTVKSVTATAGGDGTGDNGALLSEKIISSSTSAKVNKASDGGTELSITPTASIEGGNTYTFYIFIGSRANTDPVKGVCVQDVVLTGSYVSATAPSIATSSEKITLAVNPVATSKSDTFTLTGVNLTDGTYNLTVPNVDGLSVSPTSFTVTDGATSQEFTVTYTSTNDVAEAVANITATVDEITANVAVTYSSRASFYELTAVSEASTWDWTSWTAEIESKDDGSTILNKNTQYTYKDIVEICGIAAPSGFNTSAIAFKGQYPVRNKKSQNGVLTIKTSVPGTLEITFSDTGSSGTGVKRYLNINGENTEYYTQRDGKTSDSKTVTVFAYAGETAITGMGEDGTTSQAIVVTKIAFKPVTSTNITVTDALYRTFASKYPTDWSSVTGVTAYTASVSGNNVTFTKVTGTVPAGEGLLLKADAATTYTIPMATTEPAAIDNSLVGVTAATEQAAGIYVLMNGAQGLGFYQTTAAFTVGANTAYLPADVAGARTFIGFNDDETTGIAQFESEMLKDEGAYNLNGQRVAAPQKGLYIINGKKVVMK